MMLSLDMRYVGQNFELPIDMEPDISQQLMIPETSRLRVLFFKAHEMNYGYHNSDDPIEVVNLRLTAHGRLDKPPPPNKLKDTLSLPSKNGQRYVWFEPVEAIETPIYERNSLLPGQVIAGPAVIDQLDATTLVFPGDTARIDEGLNIVLKLIS